MRHRLRRRRRHSELAAELEPFRRLIATGMADVAMVAHLLNKQLDPSKPASLSPAVVTDLLRTWPKTLVRVGFGIIWLIDAILKWLPGFRAGYMDTLMGQPDGQPSWLSPWFNFWINLQHPRSTFFAYLVAVIETLIGLALITGFARKLAYLSAIVFSLLIWGTADGFGGPYTNGSSDIGTTVIYALVFAALLAFSYYQGPSRFSLDHALERRIGWWHRIAEVGRGHGLFGSTNRSRPVPASHPAT